MPYQSVTITTSSAASNSAVVGLAWRNGAPTMAAIYPSTVAASSGTWSLQFTLDDPNLVGGSSLARWSTVSSGGTTVSSGILGSVYSSTSVSADGVFFTFQAPPAALRLTSSSGVTGGVTLKVIQGESW